MQVGVFTEQQAVHVGRRVYRTVGSTCRSACLQDSRQYMQVGVFIGQQAVHVGRRVYRTVCSTYRSACLQDRKACISCYTTLVVLVPRHFKVSHVTILQTPAVNLKCKKCTSFSNGRYKKLGIAVYMDMQGNCSTTFISFWNDIVA